MQVFGVFDHKIKLGNHKEESFLVQTDSTISELA